MTQYQFVWLGAKRAQKKGVAEKGWRLDMAARAGLPVPNGGILLDDFYWLAMQEGAVEITDGRHHSPSPQALFDLLYTAVRFPRLDRPCAVRSLANISGTETKPILHVNVTDPFSLKAALCQLWSVIPPGEESRHDVLVQEMVAIAVEGTAVTLAKGGEDAITSGDQVIELPQLGGWRRPDTTLPDHLVRLQQLLRGVRRTFGAGDWQVQWVDDGRVCWLLQVQTISPST